MVDRSPSISIFVACVRMVQAFGDIAKLGHGSFFH